MPRFFKVKNYEKFQHYKDRSPPWIKLYNETLENYEFGSLKDATKGQLIGIWLLASRTDNKLPFDPKWIASKINASDPVDLEALFAAGFITDLDSEATPAEQDATPAQRLAKANGFGSRHISDATKREVWERDGGVCKKCGSRENIEYDHIHPVSKGGNSEPENVQLLCRPCNRSKRVSVATPAEQVATQRLCSRTLEREGERQDQGETKQKSPTPAKPQARESEDFIELKKIYPKRLGNYKWALAERKFNALVKTGVDPKMILAAALRLEESQRKLGNIGTQFVPMPASWLNSEDFTEVAAVAFAASVDDGMIEVLDQLQLEAWDAFGRREHGKPYPRNKKGGWRFPSKWPPGYEATMLADVEKLLSGQEIQ